MSVLIGGVTYRTVKVGRGRRLHLARRRTSTAYCGANWRSREGARVVEHGAENELLCNNCDAYARAARERRTL